MLNRLHAGYLLLNSDVGMNDEPVQKFVFENKG